MPRKGATRSGPPPETNYTALRTESLSWNKKGTPRVGG